MRAPTMTPEQQKQDEIFREVSKILGFDFFNKPKNFCPAFMKTYSVEKTAQEISEEIKTILSI